MGSLNSDGSPVLAEAGQRIVERALANTLEKAWSCGVCLFPRLSAVDGYAVRDERIEAVLEFKQRSELRDPVWVSRRKIMALRWLGRGFSVYGRRCRGLFVVECGVRIGWVDAEEVQWCKVALVGRTEKRGGAVHDQEECYLVPLDMFVWLNGGSDGAEDAEGRGGAG